MRRLGCRETAQGPAPVLRGRTHYRIPGPRLWRHGAGSADLHVSARRTTAERTAPDRGPNDSKNLSCEPRVRGSYTDSSMSHRAGALTIAGHRRHLGQAVFPLDEVERF